MQIYLGKFDRSVFQALAHFSSTSYILTSPKEGMPKTCALKNVSPQVSQLAINFKTTIMVFKFDLYL